MVIGGYNYVYVPPTTLIDASGKVGWKNNSNFYKSKGGDVQKKQGTDQTKKREWSGEAKQEQRIRFFDEEDGSEESSFYKSKFEGILISESNFEILSYVSFLHRSNYGNT